MLKLSCEGEDCCEAMGPASWLVFDWLYPRHTPLLLHTMEVFANDPQVTTPLLKFVAEFVLNKTQRQGRATFSLSHLFRCPIST